MAWLTLSAAAEKLSLSKLGLLRRLTKNARKKGKLVVAEFDGIEARKLGNTWRVNIGTWEKPPVDNS